MAVQIIFQQRFWILVKGQHAKTAKQMTVHCLYRLTFDVGLRWREVDDGVTECDVIELGVNQCLNIVSAFVTVI